MGLKDVSYSIKLPIAIVAISLLVTSASSFLQIKRFQDEALNNSIEHLALITEERSAKLLNYFDGVSRRTNTFSGLPIIANAMRMLDSTYGIIEDPQTTLQTSYIAENPYEAGQRQLLANSNSGLPYDRQHEAFHEYFLNFMIELHLYDVFLINPQGDVVYSVFKELDYATNMLTGPYSDSGLSEVFRDAMTAEKGTPSFSDFRAYAPSADAPASFIAFPIIDEYGTRVGVLAVQLPENEISSLFTTANGLGETGELLAIGQDGRARTSSRFEGRSSTFDELKSFSIFEKSPNGDMVVEENTIGLNGEIAIETGRTVSFLGTQWAVVAEIEQSEFMKPVNRARNIALLTMLASLLVMAIASLLIARSFTKPLAQLSRDVDRLRKKDFSVNFHASNQQDEIGSLSCALVELKDAVQTGEDLRKSQQQKSVEQSAAIELMSKSLARLSEGDLSQPLTENVGKDYERLRLDYNTALERLNETMSSLTDISQTMEQSAASISTSSESLSTDANMQAATLEESVAAIDELAATARQNLQTANTVQGLVLDAKSDVDHNSGVVEETIHAMENLRKSSEEISAIIGLIEDISFQTNLLALNAGVEAARAGESGKGFAVVAAEVRALAQRSSDAASEIKSLVTESTRQVETGVKLVSETSGVISTVFKKVDQVNEQMKTVSEAVSDQTTTVENLNSGMAQLDQVTQRNASMVDSFASGSQELEKQAQNLTASISQFKLSGNKSGKTNARPQMAPREQATTIKKNPPAKISSGGGAIDKIENMISNSKAKRSAPVSGNLAVNDDSIWKDF